MLIQLLVLVLILGLVAYLAQRFVAEPFRSILFVVLILILVIVLLKFSGVATGPLLIMGLG